jgi:hypothetical protein
VERKGGAAGRGAGAARETWRVTRSAGPADRSRPRAARRARPGAAGSWGLGLQIGFLAAVFALAVLVAELAGAANLGVAFGIGQIAFAISAVYILLRH